MFTQIRQEKHDIMVHVIMDIKYMFKTYEAFP